MFLGLFVLVGGVSTHSKQTMPKDCYVSFNQFMFTTMLSMRNNVWLYVELSFCTVTFMACLIVLPHLFKEMDELHAFVFDSVQEFKVSPVSFVCIHCLRMK